MKMRPTLIDHLQTHSVTLGHSSITLQTLSGALGHSSVTYRHTQVRSDLQTRFGALEIHLYPQIHSGAPGTLIDHLKTLVDYL